MARGKLLKKPKIPGPLLMKPKFLWEVPSAGPHQVAVIEVGEGIFELSCRCGSQTFTPWGMEHAKARARLHYIVNGAPIPSNAWT